MIITNNTHSIFQNIPAFLNKNFLYDVLERLGLDLFFWHAPPLEDANLPKRRYICLNVCQRRGIPFHYTPFDQGALAANLDPEWKGACNIISHSWIKRKLEAEEFLLPAIYRINDSHLPHPMIVGDNRNNGPDIAEIREELTACFGEAISKSQTQVERQLGQTGIQALLAYLKSYESHATLMSSYGLKIPLAEMQPGPCVAHASAFVKRGDQCSWLDPNHGEVTFEHFDDFALWFARETANGSLTFLLRSDQLPEKKSLVSQVYDRPQFTESERAAHPLAEQLIHKRNQAADFKIAQIPDYTLETYAKTI